MVRRVNKYSNAIYLYCTVFSSGAAGCCSLRIWIKALANEKIIFFVLGSFSVRFRN